MSLPGLGDQGLRVGEQLRQGLGAADDRHELWSSGGRNDAIVVLSTWRRAGDGSLLCSDAYISW